MSVRYRQRRRRRPGGGELLSQMGRPFSQPMPTSRKGFRSADLSAAKQLMDELLGELA